MLGLFKALSAQYVAVQRQLPTAETAVTRSVLTRRMIGILDMLYKVALGLPYYYGGRDPEKDESGGGGSSASNVEASAAQPNHVVIAMATQRARELYDTIEKNMESVYRAKKQLDKLVRLMEAWLAAMQRAGSRETDVRAVDISVRTLQLLSDDVQATFAPANLRLVSPDWSAAFYTRTASA